MPMVIALLLVSCRTRSGNTFLDPETNSQIRRLEAYIDQHDLLIDPHTAWNFLNCRNNHRNLALVRITQHTLTLDERPRAYPLLVDMRADILKVYHGSLADKTATLISAYEELLENMAVPVGRRFFLFFDDMNPDGTITVEAGSLWRYGAELEKLVTDPDGIF